MDLTKIEKQRSGLQQYLIVLMMILLGLIMVVAHGEALGFSVPFPEPEVWISALAIVCLFACLYVLSRDRRLRRTASRLVRELVEKERAVRELGNELKEGRHALEEEQTRAADLDVRLKELAALYRAISRVNSETSYDLICETALRAVLELVGGDRGSIMLLDDKREYLRIVSSLGIRGGVIKATRQKVGDGVAGWVVRYGQPTVLNGDAAADERFRDPTALTDRVNSAVCVPLNLGGQSVGVMSLGNTKEDPEFTEYHMRLATIFGQHASMAIMCNRVRQSQPTHA
ncbi:MAG: GAF domain-containing protein [Pseudomonadota bacterium]|nr:GAF domain-containing protein [Pseudomonadota bacterium]